MPEETTTITVPVPTAPTPAPVPTAVPPVAVSFTAEDIERARQQEKDKLYDRLSKNEEQLKKIQSEQEKRLEVETKARKAAEELAEAERQKTMTFEQKLAEAEQTWNHKLAGVEEQVAQGAALLEAERRFQALAKFRETRLSEESEEIMPELHYTVAGSTEEEIESAISRAKETTASILSQVQQSQANQQQAAVIARQQSRGTTVTAPPVGPMENQTGQETFTAEDIRAMDIATYAKYRDSLLGAVSAQMRR